MNLKVLWDLKPMRSSYDYDSIVSVPLMDHLRTRYHILIEFDL